MTFRADSDFPIPYGWVDPIEEGKMRTAPPNAREWPYKWLPYDSGWILEDYARNGSYSTKLARRSKAVAWLVSHKKTRSKRQEYVKELQKYIDVDIYGGSNLFCGHRR